MKMKNVLMIACAAGLAGVASVGTAADEENKKTARGSSSGEEKKAEVGTRGYLGLSFTALPPALRAHLKIDEGVGLLVRHLDPEGPAAASGIQVADIVVGLDDQIIVEGGQLVTLVRNREPGSEAKLHFYREGSKQAVTVTIGSAPAELSAEGSAAAPVPGVQFFFGDRGPLSGGGGAGTGGAPQHFQLDIDPNQIMEELRGQLREHGIYLDEILKRGDQPLKPPGAGRLRLPFDTKPEASEAPEADEGGNLRIIQSDVTSIQISDGEHHISLNGRDGDFRLLVRDTENRLVYDGPYNGEGDHGKVPESVRRKIEDARRMIEKQREEGSGAGVPVPEDPAPGESPPEKTI